jgi:hypothetical protein
MTPSYNADGCGLARARRRVRRREHPGRRRVRPGLAPSALKENRQRAYDDFMAVAEDLIARRITSPRTSASWAAATAAC